VKYYQKSPRSIGFFKFLQFSRNLNYISRPGGRAMQQTGDYASPELQNKDKSPGGLRPGRLECSIDAD
jgi:hypothetical protein